MAAVTIQWDQRVAGREPGDIETVEETFFILGCLQNLRCHIIDAPEAGPEVAPEFPVFVGSPVETVDVTPELPAPVAAEPQAADTSPEVAPDVPGSPE